MVNKIVDMRMFFVVINDFVVEIIFSSDDDCLRFFCDLLLVDIIVVVGFLLLLWCYGFCNSKYDVIFLEFILTPCVWLCGFYVYCFYYWFCLLPKSNYIYCSCYFYCTILKSLLLVTILKKTLSCLTNSCLFLSSNSINNSSTSLSIN